MGINAGMLSAVQSAAFSVSQIGAERAGIEADASRLIATDGAMSPAANGFNGAHSGTSFADNLQAVVQSVDSKEHIAADKIAAVESGRSDDLVGAMLSSQEASLSFSMLLQVRNKVVGAVDELIKLQL